MGRLGLVRIRPRSALGSSPAQHALVASCFAASLFLGNAAYLGLSVAFIGILKALTPVATLAASLALGLERMSLPVGVATALIAAGTMLATAQVRHLCKAAPEAVTPGSGASPGPQACGLARAATQIEPMFQRCHPPSFP